MYVIKVTEKTRSWKKVSLLWDRDRKPKSYRSNHEATRKVQSLQKDWEKWSSATVVTCEAVHTGEVSEALLRGEIEVY